MRDGKMAAPGQRRERARTRCDGFINESCLPARNDSLERQPLPTVEIEMYAGFRLDTQDSGGIRVKALRINYVRVEDRKFQGFAPQGIEQSFR